jgi:hypothetical protein
MAASKNVKKADGTQTIFGADHKVVGNIAASKAPQSPSSLIDPDSYLAVLAANRVVRQNAAIDSVEASKKFVAENKNAYGDKWAGWPNVGNRVRIWELAHGVVARNAPFADMDTKNKAVDEIVHGVTTEYSVAPDWNATIFDIDPAIDAAQAWDYEGVKDAIADHVEQDVLPAHREQREDDVAIRVGDILDVEGEEVYWMVGDVFSMCGDNASYRVEDFMKSEFPHHGLSGLWNTGNALAVLDRCSYNGRVTAESLEDVDALLSLTSNVADLLDAQGVIRLPRQLDLTPGAVREIEDRLKESFYNESEVLRAVLLQADVV